MIDLLLYLSALISPPLPAGLCVVDLFGHVRIRGTVRRRWFGPIAMLEIESHEPDPEPPRIVSPLAIYSLRAATGADADALERDHCVRAERIERERQDEQERRDTEARCVAAEERGLVIHFRCHAEDYHALCGSGAPFTTEIRECSCRDCIDEYDSELPF